MSMYGVPCGKVNESFQSNLLHLKCKIRKSMTTMPKPFIALNRNPPLNEKFYTKAASKLHQDHLYYITYITYTVITSAYDPI
jgi:hypothetical protein